MISFSGIVLKGRGRGRGFGFPTANLSVSASLEVEEGIYVAHAFFDGKAFPALAFFGIPKMFGESEKKLEAHVLDFDGDLYGKEMRVELQKKIRDSKDFANEEELVFAMKEDLRVAREYFDAKNL
ncbi:hypothetical protein A3A21_03130 [Candidatus Jorgensenbacteria bacterium RIFCSPLOWO2_01_FULL_45_25b]|uniref:riboflavin kinase n=1 Tax=Candidatus Jorgensenbacteria bacterium RIFCSPLOWO2_01_FULL_45_25b TaxID=1798471 RepID=A0A1F6BWQ3_9BACT|nr:MAG: hypothetical protein A3A21_03130 [Candidatus Jorgensenbacteria bacterium RIFCSPLOWO2_01_FULL_45_25b]